MTTWPEWTVRQNDTGPPVPFALVSESTRQPVDLSTATSITGHLYRPDDAGTELVASRACTAVDLPNGRFAFPWDAADTAEAGTLLLEIEIVLADTTKESYPDGGYVYVTVRTDLNGS